MATLESLSENIEHFRNALEVTDGFRDIVEGELFELFHAGQLDDARLNRAYATLMTICTSLARLEHNIDQIEQIQDILAHFTETK